MRCFAIAAGFVLAATAMFALSPLKAQTTPTSESGCWLYTNGPNYHWGDCLRGIRGAAWHPRAASAFAKAGEPAIMREAGCWLSTVGTHYRWGDCLKR